MNIGERVGDYEIVDILGAGGMGQVYKVRNVISNRIEAMKVLLPNLGGDPALTERFLREIQVQASLDHPNIARLHTAYMAGDQVIMILEYVEGSTIEKLMEHGALGVRETIRCLGQVLDALAYAHDRGVIHRDIKPANIIRTSTGSIKLMDFGIARMQQDRRLTQTGSTVGSLFYMSPEQIRGAQPDPRSDLYSLGVTMYEMVTGRRPFEGTSDYTIMAAHLQQVPVAPIEVVPGVPPAVNDIILMAIAKDPAQRFQTAQAFRGALESVSAGGPPPIARTVTSPSVPPPVPPAIPAPIPYAFPPPPIAPQPSSKRGLYMTLGSIATVGVIALAIFAAPRFLRTGAATTPPAVDQPAPTPVPEPPAQPQSPAPDIPAPAVEVQPAPPQISTPPVTAQPTPVLRQPPPAAQPKPVPAVKQQVQQPVQQPIPPPVLRQPPQPPAEQPAPPPVAQQPPLNTPAPRPAPAAAPSPELNDLRQDYNLLAIRVATAKTGLRNIEQQQRRQGLNLRGDMVEAESRMDYLMKESMDSMRSNDVSSSRRSLQMAERALESIEKFLGR